MMKILSLNCHCGIKTLRNFAFIATAFLITFSFSGNTNADENVFPFHTGEKLTLQAKWGFIAAGEAVLEVLPVEIVNGVKSCHFVMTLKTYPFIDLFYKVRDRIDSYADVGMTHSILYKEQKRGRSKKDVVVNINREKREAKYSKNGKMRRLISILPGSFDPLSVFYAFRIHELKEGLVINVPVTDGKKCIMGIAKVIKREKINVNGRTYDTYLVEPDLEHIGGVFEKSKDAKLQLWVTADKLQIPVRVKSKVIVGSFVGDLISAEGIGQGLTLPTKKMPR
ncbi:MAG: DUF3108 domain-containing protein [Deltaproteobacteria bacterium]|nr:DUF3108 domain-containing protein [Deltaproteobacteria bacterium]